MENSNEISKLAFHSINFIWVTLIGMDITVKIVNLSPWMMQEPAS